MGRVGGVLRLQLVHQVAVGQHGGLHQDRPGSAVTTRVCCLQSTRAGASPRLDAAQAVASPRFDAAQACCPSLMGRASGPWLPV